MSSTNATAARIFSKLCQTRHTARRFRSPSPPIPDPVLRCILDSTLRTPTSFNLQPYSIVLVRDDLRKKGLARHAMLGGANIGRCADASLLAVFCSDQHPTKRVDRIVELERETAKKRSGDDRAAPPQYLDHLPLTSSYLTGESGVLAYHFKDFVHNMLSPLQATPAPHKASTWSAKNATMAAMSFTYAATSHNLGSVLMEGYDVMRLREYLRIPDRYEIPIVIALGHEDETDNSDVKSGRLGIDEMVFDKSWGKGLVLENTGGEKE
mmetsp:Transcript_3676/g.7636  ORF Transcript_3676/g.7636 Transcript_3676/m.7636 type:complete len:267 (-) Transcript_3676:377-1177(-)